MQAYLPQLAQDLLWLGLDWDTGWQPGDTEYTQSHPPRRLPDRLSPAGGAGPGLPCFCTRKELLAAAAPHAADGARVYDGRCRRLSPREKAALWTSGRSPAWRVQVPAETVPLQMAITAPRPSGWTGTAGDFILRRSDGVYAYQLAVAADGAMGITGWCGGTSSPPPPADLAAGQLGYRCPPTARPLLLAPDSRRLSKQDQDLDVGYLRPTPPQKRSQGCWPGWQGSSPGQSRCSPGNSSGTSPGPRWAPQDKVVDEAAWQAL